jgi:hypothetical protein
MAVQLISYDLKGPNADYADLFADIKSYGTWLVQGPGVRLARENG